MRCVDTVPVVRVQVASEDLSFEQCRLTATEHRGIAQAIADTDVHEPSEWYSSWSEANLTAAGSRVLDVLRSLYPLAPGLQLPAGSFHWTARLGNRGVPAG